MTSTRAVQLLQTANMNRRSTPPSGIGRALHKLRESVGADNTTEAEGKGRLSPHGHRHRAASEARTYAPLDFGDAGELFSKVDHNYRLTDFLQVQPRGSWEATLAVSKHQDGLVPSPTSTRTSVTSVQVSRQNSPSCPQKDEALLASAWHDAQHWPISRS